MAQNEMKAKPALPKRVRSGWVSQVATRDIGLLAFELGGEQHQAAARRLRNLVPIGSYEPGANAQPVTRLCFDPAAVD